MARGWVRDRGVSGDALELIERPRSPWHNVRMGKPVGFEWTQRKNGDVVVTDHARMAAILRGTAAIKFVTDVGRGDPQEVMARVTGDYNRGNERLARKHSRRFRRP